jgi:hypothetical protein
VCSPKAISLPNNKKLTAAVISTKVVPVSLERAICPFFAASVSFFSVGSSVVLDLNHLPSFYLNLTAN